MNKERESAIQICIALITECGEIGEISEASHQALVAALQEARQGEYWSLRNMSRHAGQNDSTDEQIARSEHALPELEAAANNITREDYVAALGHLRAAIAGKPARKVRK